PALALQVTSLVDSYMLWVGTTEAKEEDVKSGSAIEQGVLARDWACAMPPLPNSPIPPLGTALFSTAASDFALAMAQRLARRFKKQIFLSIDVPPAFLSMGQGPAVLLAMERSLVAALKELE
ncbi:hypothetical protein PUNSTDRAFT_37554, partial [Punctularia strigosozonata HHB-11173 SS5]|uniref:uncharacterized protein n=1 Tax=Punctularia strigosozonata (strain HHB-11173) TaxID=741275 RepID=UPI0004416578